MNQRNVLVVVILGAAVYFLAFRKDAFGRTLLDSITGPTPLEPRQIPLATVPLDLESFPTVTGSQNVSGTVPKLITGGAAAGAAILPGLLGGGATAGAGTAAGASAGGAGAAGAAGGISTAAALTAAGVAAGAAVLAWAIISKGLFRGGEEALKVNPARDAWFDKFIQTYYPGAGSERQFDAYGRAAANAGVPGYEAEALLRAIYAADTIRKWQVAADNVAATFNRYASLQAA